MGFFELFILKSEKKKMKFLRYETEDMINNLRFLVENYEIKVKLLPELTSSWPKKNYNAIAEKTHVFKTHILRSHEHKAQIASKAKELEKFLAEVIREEKIIEHQRIEMRMRSQYLQIIELCSQLDHVLVQQAIFLQEEGQALFSRRIVELVMWSKQEIALYEQLDKVFDELEIEIENVRQKLKHERYVEEEYEHVSDKNYPQIRQNMGG